MQEEEEEESNKMEGERTVSVGAAYKLQDKEGMDGEVWVEGGRKGGEYLQTCAAQESGDSLSKGISHSEEVFGPDHS